MSKMSSLFFVVIVSQITFNLESAQIGSDDRGRLTDVPAAIVPLGRWDLSLIRRIWRSKGTCRKRGSLVSFPFSSPCPQDVGGVRRGFFRMLGEFSQAFDYRRKSWVRRSDGKGETEGVEMRWQQKDICGMSPSSTDSKCH